MLVAVIILSVCLFLAVCLGFYMSYKYFKEVRRNQFDSLYTHVDEVRRGLREDLSNESTETNRRFEEVWNYIQQ